MSVRVITRKAALVLLFVFVTSLVMAPVVRAELGNPADYGKPGKHRLTGILKLVNPKEGAFRVEGRRKSLAFVASPQKLEGLKSGEKVRVFYKVDETKKVVVLRLKKVNNVNASVDKSSGSGRKRIED